MDASPGQYHPHRYYSRAEALQSLLYESLCATSGKPSTWLPLGRLVEQALLVPFACFVCFVCIARFASGRRKHVKNYNPMQEDDLGETIALSKVNVRSRQVDILKAYDHT